MKKLYLTLGLLMCFTSQIHAGIYAIQLAASKTPQLASFAQLETFGDLYTTDAGNGFIRTRLGPYPNKQSALETLDKVHTAGHPAAFLVNYISNENSGAGMMIKDSASTYNSAKMQMLTAEQQANVVNLDGTLHIKNGDDFTPLSQLIK